MRLDQFSDTSALPGRGAAVVAEAVARQHAHSALGAVTTGLVRRLYRAAHHRRLLVAVLHRSSSGSIQRARRVVRLRFTCDGLLLDQLVEVLVVVFVELTVIR